MHKFCVVYKIHSFFFRIYREGLGEAYDRDIAFASSLETFGGGHTDPVGVSFGGSILSLSLRTTCHINDLLLWRHSWEDIVEHRQQKHEHHEKVNYIEVTLAKTSSRGHLRPTKTSFLIGSILLGYRTTYPQIVCSNF